MKVSDELATHGPLFWAVSLPIHKILEPSATTAHIQELPHRKGRVIVDDPRWREIGRRAEWAGRNWFKLRDIECGVDFHGAG